MATFMPIPIVIICLYLKHVLFGLIYCENKSNKPEYLILILIAVWHSEGSVVPVQMCRFARVIAAPIHKKDVD